MAIQWGPAIAAGISSAAGLVGGFMNRGLSQRDLMQAQSEFALRHRRDELKFSPTWEMQGLRRAGINPMLPYSNGGAPNPSGFSPGIAAPINPGMDLAGSVSAGVSSAIDLFRTEAQVEEIEARADLLVKQALTEAEKPAHVRALTAEATAGALSKEQQARLSVFQQELTRQDIEVRTRDALIAGIHAGLWKEADEVVSAVLRKLRLSDEVIPQALGVIDQLRQLDQAAQGWVGQALQWWNDNFDSSQEEKSHW